MPICNLLLEYKTRQWLLYIFKALTNQNVFVWVYVYLCVWKNRIKLCHFKLIYLFSIAQKIVAFP